MWWELIKYPSEDARAQVFWRRRVSVLAGLAGLLLLVLVVMLRGGGSGSATRASAENPVPPSGTGTSTGAGTGTGSGASASRTQVAALPQSPAAPTPGASSARATAAGSGAAPVASDPATTCAGGSMALRLASDAPAYATGRQPVLTLTVVDIGTASCTADLGTKSTSISVLSGGKPVWTSNACTTKTARPTQLSPSSAQILQLRWDLSRNTAGCAAAAGSPPPGQYEIVARVGKTAVYGGNFALE
jgi:hypothetical protein